MNILVLASLLTFSVLTQASDNWDTCATPDGKIQIENGEIVAPPQNSEENYRVVKKLRTKKLRHTKETCTLRASRQVVTSLEEEVSYVVFQIGIGEVVGPMDFICNQGGSGIPASDSCDEKTAKTITKYF